MYFSSRAEAGRKLAKLLGDYSTENVAVIALNTGGVLVGAQIAMKIHASLSMLLSKDIYLPGEINPLAAVTSGNVFTYNKMFSVGELEEMKQDYWSYIEQSKMQGLHELNVILGSDGEIDRHLLNRKTLILTSDGFQNGFSLDVAADFLKPVNMRKLIIAAPFATISSLDRIHLLADEIHCLDVIENFFGTDHYYDDNTMPKTADLLKVIRNTPIHWQH
ncbi:MAG: phosphoribosyltransferase family protein [Candidatus Saccharimonadales bacterium]